MALRLLGNLSDPPSALLRPHANPESERYLVGKLDTDFPNSLWVQGGYPSFRDANRHRENKNPASPVRMGGVFDGGRGKD
ncbi:MAG: hypothetical protein U5M50_05780 [Sphingobium sp.]|nr:hypothetical protein [Sphingobium sp.]